MKIKCTSYLSLGLFAIDEGSLWVIDGIKYNKDKKNSVVRILEQNSESPMWAEIPQVILAEYFEIA